jgi:proteic killer suppression protein
MIVTFKNSDTEKVFKGYYVRSLPTEILKRAYKQLWNLDTIESIEDLLSPPSNHLEKLSGDRAGKYSIRINIQWRICFVWSDGNVYDVEIVDYH